MTDPTTPTTEPLSEVLFAAQLAVHYAERHDSVRFTPGCTSRRAPLATRSGPRGTSHPAPSAAATWTVPTPTAPEAQA